MHRAGCPASGVSAYILGTGSAVDTTVKLRAVARLELSAVRGAPIGVIHSLTSVGSIRYSDLLLRYEEAASTITE